MGSEDNKFKEEYLATTRARKCIKISFSYQLYSVLQVELHSTEEFNPLLLLLPSGDREQSSVLLSTPQSGTQSTQRLSAQQSTRKTVSINGRDMAMIRCGLQLLELARVIHMRHVLMCPNQKLFRSPTLSAGIFQNKNV